MYMHMHIPISTMTVLAILGQDPVVWDSGAPGHPPNVRTCLILELN